MVDGLSARFNPGLEKAGPDPFAQAPDEASIGILTNGTTGPPKRVHTPMRLLTRAAMSGSTPRGGPEGWMLALGVTWEALGWEGRLKEPPRSLPDARAGPCRTAQRERMVRERIGPRAETWVDDGDDCTSLSVCIQGVTAREPTASSDARGSESSMRQATRRVPSGRRASQARRTGW